jgi:hypothetical protein
MIIKSLCFCFLKTTTTNSYPKSIRLVHICKLSVWEADTGGLQGQGQPGLYREFKANLGKLGRPGSKKIKAQLHLISKLGTFVTSVTSWGHL